MNKHTQEPWWTNGHEIGDMPMMNTKISNSISGSSYEEAVSNAERIVACVNYCKGVSNEDMNGNTLEGDLRKGMEKIENLTKQRDELLAMFEEVVAFGNHGDVNNSIKFKALAVKAAEERLINFKKKHINETPAQRK